MEPYIAADVMLLPTAYAVWTFVSETHAVNMIVQCIYDLYEELFLAM